MEEKHELSDIMLDKNTGRTSKMKKILLLSIVLIILFLLILAGMKLINKPKVKKNNFNIILPPEPATKVEKPIVKDELFKQVPIIEENNDTEKNNFDAMVKKIKEKEKEKVDKFATHKAKQDEKIAKVKAKTKNIQKKIKKHTKIPKKIKTTKPKKQKIKKSVYIQVGITFKGKPDKKYLEKITKAGYKYTLYPVKISGRTATKVLIGPYINKKAARNSINKIKQKINKAAFIYVIK
ncbi:MAG: SPOR domain-containing protein [Epsilonproteobacteria bacterium]|nr:SPOR domain-containing protein [Campylobacterota bacterium]